MTIYLNPEDVEDHIQNYKEILREKDFDEERINEKVQDLLKNKIVLIYSKEWQDENLNFWIHTILDVPGGYWIVQDLIRQPHCEYEHYKWRHKMSYEKANVGDQTAQRELTDKSYEIYQIAKRLAGKTEEHTIRAEITKHL